MLGIHTTMHSLDVQVVGSVTEFAMEIRNEREKEKKTVFLCHFCCCERAAYSSAISHSTVRV
jgi:hypothetical protein